MIYHQIRTRRDQNQKDSTNPGWATAQWPANLCRYYTEWSWLLGLAERHGTRHVADTWCAYCKHIRCRHAVCLVFKLNEDTCKRLIRAKTQNMLGGCSLLAGLGTLGACKQQDGGGEGTSLVLKAEIV